jgi:hypothetical protein
LDVNAPPLLVAGPRTEPPLGSALREYSPAVLTKAAFWSLSLAALDRLSYWYFGLHLWGRFVVHAEPSFLHAVPLDSGRCREGVSLFGLSYTSAHLY